MTKRNFIQVLLLLVFILGGCNLENPPAPVTPAPTPTPAPMEETEPAPVPEPTQTPDLMEERIRAMSEEELVGQLMVAGVEGTVPGEDGRTLLEEIRPGGIILFGRNVANAGQLVELTNGLKVINVGAGNIPVFLCVDEEGGMVSRMPAEVADLPNAYDQAQAGEDLARRGELLAEECAAFGFQVDFAPVLDVWSNPQNTVIGRRASGTDFQEVTRLGAELLEGFSRVEGVLPVGKHFPGHGDTVTDSHVGLPVVDKTREELLEGELLPFRRAIDDGIPALMAGHILLPELDPLLPASLSPAVITGLLREELGFEGLVFTDDLTMGAISGTYSVGQAAVKAVEAGCDMVLVCHRLDNARTVQKALLTALADGTLTRDRLEESARRILAAKAACHVTDDPISPPDVEKLNRKIHDKSPEDAEASAKP